jgi:hypothetical protein
LWLSKTQKIDWSVRKRRSSWSNSPTRWIFRQGNIKYIRIWIYVNLHTVYACLPPTVELWSARTTKSKSSTMNLKNHSPSAFCNSANTEPIPGRIYRPRAAGFYRTSSWADHRAIVDGGLTTFSLFLLLIRYACELITRVLEF